MPHLFLCPLALAVSSFLLVYGRRLLHAGFVGYVSIHDANRLVPSPPTPVPSLLDCNRSLANPVTTCWYPLSASAIFWFWPRGGRRGCPRVWILHCRCRRPSGARFVRPPFCLGHVFGLRDHRPPPSRSLVRLFPARLCRRRWIRPPSAHRSNLLIRHFGGGPCPLSCALVLGFFTARLHVT